MPPRKRAAKKAAPAAEPAQKTDEVLEEVMQLATQADNDLELMLAEYQQLAERYREPKEHKEKREALRDKIARELAHDGPRYYLDDEGNKRYAWQTTPETVQVDIDLLMELDEAGEVPFDLLDKVAPRQVNRAGLRSAIQSGALSPEQVVKIATITYQTPRIYMKSAESDSDG